MGDAIIDSDEDDEGDEAEADVGWDDWVEWRQRQIDLLYIKQELRDQALLGHISANLTSLIAAAGGTVPMKVAATGGLDGGLAEQLPCGSEPPPTPAAQRRRRQVKSEEEHDGAIDVKASMVDDRYRNACSLLGLQTKPAIMKALRALEGGASGIPLDFAYQAYLGNRGGQAFFLALAAESDDIGCEASELRELRTLELSGQGLGNEAADALSVLLQRCPRLRSVNLSRNHISEPGAQKLLQEIQLHPSLEIINLDRNPVPSWLRVQIKDVMAGRKDDPWHDTDVKEATRKLLKDAQRKPTVDSGEDSGGNEGGGRGTMKPRA